MKNTTIMAKVKALLKSNKSLRDNDRALCVAIWKTESAGQFLNAYLTGKLTNAESIRRTRQLVQEINPTLRGKNYGKRKKLAEEVRTSINVHKSAAKIKAKR